MVIKAVADYVRNIQDVTGLEAIAKDIFKHSQVRLSKALLPSVCQLLKVYNFRDLESQIAKPRTHLLATWHIFVREGNILKKKKKGEKMFNPHYMRSQF